MPDLGLQSFNKLYPMMIRKYQDLVVDQNASEKDKINSIIQKLNALGKLSNDVVRDWNTVYNWTMNDGLNTDVSNKLEEMRANGEISQLLQNIFDSLVGSMSNLHTNAKDLLVNAINEVDDLAKANQTTIATNTTNITTNTTTLSKLTKKTNIRIDVVADYGADPTGATSSDTAISNAITAIVNTINTLSSPAILWFPQGTYTFNNPFPLITNNISIQGNGMYNTTLNFNHTNGANCITMGNDTSPINGVVCSGFAINGNTQTGHGLYINYAINSKFNTINAKYCGGDGIHYEKGWEVRFHDIRCTNNTGYGFYASAKMEAYSELNDINIEESYFAHNGILGVQLGNPSNTYTAEEGYNINVKSSYLGNNGLGQIGVSGMRNVVIEKNYMEDAGTAVPNGTNAYHIYVGLRTNGGIGTAHAVTIRDNHFNAMNDSHVTPAINNALGYAIILDKVIGVHVSNNMFFNSVQGSIWATSSANKITIMPNIHYEYLTGAVSVKDDTGGKLFWMDNWGSTGSNPGQFTGGTMSFNGQVTGNFLQQQGFENLIKNGDFGILDSSNNPLGFNTQSLTFSLDTDGALIGTGVNGGTFQKIEQVMSSNRYSFFKGKYVTFCAEVKIPSTNSSSLTYKTAIIDGVSETDLILAKDDTYHDVMITRKIDPNATKLQFTIGTIEGTAGVNTDKIYVRNMRAFLGQMPLAYERMSSDHGFLMVSALPTASINYQGKTLILKGNGTTTADTMYICLMSSTGTYSWKQLITG